MIQTAEVVLGQTITCTRPSLPHPSTNSRRHIPHRPLSQNMNWTMMHFMPKAKLFFLFNNKFTKKLLHVPPDFPLLHVTSLFLLMSTLS